MRLSTAKRVSAAAGIALAIAAVGSGAASAATTAAPSVDQRSVPSAAPSAAGSVAGSTPQEQRIDSDLQQITGASELNNVDQLRQWNGELSQLSEQLSAPESPIEYQNAVHGVINQLGYAEKKVGTPEYPSIEQGLKDAATKALQTAH